MALLVSANAHQYQVVEIAKVASPVGSHGPALINLHWPNTWPGSYWGKGGWGGNSGIDKTQFWKNGERYEKNVKCGKKNIEEKKNSWKNVLSVEQL